MLRIRRLRVEINTINGMCGIDETFIDGLNFIASIKNSCGKSSVLEAIYYALGFEQIIGGAGGTGSKVLTAVFKSAIQEGDDILTVQASRVYLEISNGNEVITIRRNVKDEATSNHLVTVYYDSYENIGKPSILASDYYVNTSGSAKEERGFHTFLEEFLHLQLPIVRASDGNERKLYMQMIFAAMFIEQKHGWSGLLSGMPVFGIRESKKRVIEYILALDTLKNEKERERLGALKIELEKTWEQLITDIQRSARTNSCDIIHLPMCPEVLSESDYSRISIVDPKEKSITELIESLKKEYAAMRETKPSVTENFEALSEELTKTEVSIFQMETSLQDVLSKATYSSDAIRQLNENLEIVNRDIRNNTDAARLQKFGSEAFGEETSAEICPTCKQHIQDNLLNSDAGIGYMTIEENIRHLKEQQKMLEFSLDSRNRTRELLRIQQQNIESSLLSLRRLAQTLRSDLNAATDTEASEAIVLKRVRIADRIEDLTKLEKEREQFLQSLHELVNQWSIYLGQKKKLPTKGFSPSDQKKLQLLNEYFVDNLKRYNYSSLTRFDGIEVSQETLLPTIDGFDMKFDSSASDGIRVIWAYTMALLKVSIETDGNHPGLVIFDEPAQQSIVPEDMRSFIDSTAELIDNCQIITAITLNSSELTEIISSLDQTSYKRIDIHDKAFMHIDRV